MEELKLIVKIFEFPYIYIGMLLPHHFNDYYDVITKWIPIEYLCEQFFKLIKIYKLNFSKYSYYTNDTWVLLVYFISLIYFLNKKEMIKFKMLIKRK